jgi:hypothetical protein
MTVLATRIAALSEVLFAALMVAFALSIPLRPSENENGALLMLGVQAGLALVAAAGLFRRKWWGWLVAIGVLALAFGPISIALYRSWRDGIGVGVMMPANAVMLVAVGWAAQLVVAVCFVMARGRRAPTPGTS